ncbi:MAG: efflux RND transporter periplasmic adaptor subunit, partial [Bacteroidales bacterium]|nr:efflux RND transporter periplasmic adaptor subunit [Bacteroidales bacterium]
RVYGRAKPNERLIQNLTSPIAGRVETLFVNSAGFSVSKGQLLAYIFSPEFMTAQQELLVTKKMKSSLPELYEAARDKLRFWKITDDQIDAIEQSENIWPGFPVMSPTDGVITSLRVNLGDYISQGTVLFELADFSILRVEFDVYESDLPFLKVGDSISFIFQALPQRKFGSKITIIDPMLDPVTRVFRILTEIKNTEGIVKPQMFATGIIRSKVGNVNDKPLVIPRSAVLWTGKRSIVYVKLAETDRPTFLLREVILGASLGDRYIVESGLSEGEEIVVEGAFSIDAAAQLAGKKSMMSME